MAGQNLDWDVLAIICEFLAVSDILSFTLTCSLLRPLATRRLLSMRPIDLRSREMIRMFHSFVFADAPARTPHVRALDIDSKSSPVLCPLLSELEPDDTSLLIDIIIVCPFLGSISVDLQDYLRHILFNDSGISCTAAIINAIAGIQSLHSLSVNGNVVNALELLRKIRAPLRTLNVGDLIWDLATIDEFLPRFAPTLKKLGLHHFVVDAKTIVHGVTASNSTSISATQYPAVCSVSISCFVHEPMLGHLLRLFPSLDDTLSIGTILQRGSENDYPGLRAANHHAQSGSPSRAWKKLDRIVCGPAMLFILGLRCPIRLVMLDHCDPDKEHLAAEALRENPVPRLKLSLLLEREGQPSLYGSVFSPELARVLTHLTVCLRYAYRGYAPWAGSASSALRSNDVLVALRSALQPLHNLKYLRVVMHASSVVYASVSTGNPFARPNAVPDEFVHEIRGSTFDFVGAARLLVRPLPSLQFIYLTTCGYVAQMMYNCWREYEQWKVTKAWRLTERPSDTDTAQDTGPLLVPLHEEVSKTIMRREELVISEMDEKLLRMYDD